jgi:hypothetical protein
MMSALKFKPFAANDLAKNLKESFVLMSERIFEFFRTIFLYAEFLFSLLKAVVEVFNSTLNLSALYSDLKSAGSNIWNFILKHIGLISCIIGFIYLIYILDKYLSLRKKLKELAELPRTEYPTLVDSIGYAIVDFFNLIFNNIIIVKIRNLTAGIFTIIKQFITGRVPKDSSRFRRFLFFFTSLICKIIFFFVVVINFTTLFYFFVKIYQGELVNFSILGLFEKSIKTAVESIKFFTVEIVFRRTSELYNKLIKWF